MVRHALYFPIQDITAHYTFIFTFNRNPYNKDCKAYDTNCIFSYTRFHLLIGFATILYVDFLFGILYKK